MELNTEEAEQLLALISNLNSKEPIEEFPRDKFINMSLRQLERFGTVQKLTSFYIRKKVKEGKLIPKRDHLLCLTGISEYFFSKMKNNLTSETQLEELAFKSEEEIRSIIVKQDLASLCELAYENLEQKFKLCVKPFQIQIQTELKKEIEPFVKFEANETSLTYREKIIQLLDTTEDTIRAIIDEINYKCEFERVIIFIVCCNTIAGLPKRDRKNLHEEKRKFKRLKTTTISNLKKLGVSYNEVEEKVFSSPEDLGWYNYETTLKHYKAILLHTLTKDCRTGQKKASTIVSILDYL
ncbi:MAG: hypothetical protein KAI79_02040 [Bacteroidales bacterium]|nr:hypothetical protein [Bacteroidales bacterium]